MIDLMLNDGAVANYEREELVPPISRGKFSELDTPSNYYWFNTEWCHQKLYFFFISYIFYFIGLTFLFLGFFILF